MFYEIMLEGVKKFAGEIIGVLLLVIVLKKFNWIRLLFGEYKNLQEDSGNKQEIIQQNPEESKRPIMSDKDFVNLCKSGKVSEIEEAINNGANVNAKDHNITPLMGVLQCNVELADLVEMLIKKGADINAKDNFSYNALMRATSKNYTKTAELLIKNGADVNALDCYGNTALMVAAAKGNIESSELLIKYGADINVKDNKGMTALMWAEKYKRTEVADLLRSYGAKE